VIEQMVRDLDVPVRLVFGETLREPDGLAMSSRNSYLSPEERGLAPVLQRALQDGVEALRNGADAGAAEEAMHRTASLPGVEIDYLTLVDPQTFEHPVDLQRPLLVAGAVRIGRTRLIDNLRV
jgi:pantoate--beta-alanine ligase